MCWLSQHGSWHQDDKAASLNSALVAEQQSCDKLTSLWSQHTRAKVTTVKDGLCAYRMISIEDVTCTETRSKNSKTPQNGLIRSEKHQGEYWHNSDSIFPIWSWMGGKHWLSLNAPVTAIFFGWDVLCKKCLRLLQDFKKWYTVSIPFIDGLSQEACRPAHTAGIMCAFHTPNKLKSLFAAKDLLPMGTTAFAMCLVRCKTSSQQFIDET